MVSSTDANTTIRGYTGAAVTGDVFLVLYGEALPGGNGSAEVYRFDLTKPKGTPELVHRTPPSTIGSPNRIHLPAAYSGKVALVSEGYLGATVLRSRDGKWRSAEHLLAEAV